jgi:AGZA family xanthine/uracil permease-like MFS transporter
VDRLKKYFDFEGSKTNLKTEFIAGVTIFMTMAYIIFLNPLILQDTGMNFKAVALATILATVVGCALRVLFAPNLPFAVAPGMGLNTFFTYSLCIGMGVNWQTALGIVFWSGLVFTILCILPFRKKNHSRHT